MAEKGRGRVQRLCLSTGPEKTFGHDLGMHITLRCGDNYDSEWHDKYIEILEDNLWPVIARHFPEQDCLFQDDNAPIHRANDVKNYKEENHINCLEWPAQSPDLNVIENVWLKLRIRLQQRVEVLNTADELSAAIKDIWENLSVDYIQGLYHSIPKRLRKVLKVKGEMTKY